MQMLFRDFMRRLRVIVPKGTVTACLKLTDRVSPQAGQVIEFTLSIWEGGRCHVLTEDSWDRLLARAADWRADNPPAEEGPPWPPVYDCFDNELLLGEGEELATE